MKKKILLFSSLAAALLFAVAFYACNKSDAAQSGQQFSEDALFRGIMFNEGQVADLIPQLKSNQIKPEDVFDKKEDVKAVYDTRDKILASIKKADPAFLAYFKKEVTSGNTERIKKAYKRGSERIYSSLLEVNNIHSRESRNAFNKQIQASAKKYTIMNTDGTLNKAATESKLKSLVSENGLQPGKRITTLDDDDCIEVAAAGVVVIIAVVVFVVVEAAAVTDTYAWVTSGEASAFSGNVDNKLPLYLEELIGEVAVNLKAAA